ncbi:MAG TPA: hypothetical protein VLJ42_10190 [Solirubrobacteraceae bacterium]|nr:hypothetical protein [Solirubrobacteraceae bacterium]
MPPPPTSAGSHEVVWLAPRSSAYAPPPMPARPRSGDRATAWIVIALTFACTALALFDMYLLMSASAPA